MRFCNNRLSARTEGSLPPRNGRASNTKEAPMNAIVIKHVKVEELPQAWLNRFAQVADLRVTVHIEEEAQPVAPTEEFVTDDPAFGIWRDREDMADVTAYVRKLRASRYNRDGSRTES
jgi:hypothetical protein